ncbi:hypothetical protein D3C84_631010 [compost metagenome]
MAAEGGAVEQQPPRQRHQQQDPDRDGNAQQAAVIDGAVAIAEGIVQGQGAAIGQIGQDGPKDAEGAEGDDEWLNLAPGDEQAVTGAKQQAEQQG